MTSGKLSKRKESELRLIADLALEATLAAEERLTRLTPKAGSSARNSALVEEVQRKEKEERVSSLRKAKKSLSKVPDGEIISAVRETREVR